jgi:hypothetical protein
MICRRHILPKVLENVGRGVLHGARAQDLGHFRL